MDARKPIDPKKKERYAELVGLGLSHPEASGATGISERSGERLMAEPGFRKIAEKTKLGRGMQGEAAQVVRDLLLAVKPDGTPDLAMRHKGVLAMRHKGVEAYMKNPALLEGEGDEEELLPDGVLLVYPVPPALRDPEPGWKARLERKLSVGATVRYPDGRCAVVREARDSRGNISAGRFRLEDLEPGDDRAAVRDR
jgi:hypothetical protein